MNKKKEWYPEQSVGDPILQECLEAGYTTEEAYTTHWRMEAEAEEERMKTEQTKQ